MKRLIWNRLDSIESIFFSEKNEIFLHVKPYEYFTEISKIFHMLFLSMFISFRPDRHSGQQIIVCTTRYLPIICNMLYNMNFKLFLVMRPSLGNQYLNPHQILFSWILELSLISKYHSKDASKTFVWLELGIHLKPNKFKKDTSNAVASFLSRSTSKTFQKCENIWQRHLTDHHH